MTTWDGRILRTELRGRVTADDVRVWREGLLAAARGLPRGEFRLLLDLRGFEAADLAAHKEMREVVPRLLAEHGMRPAFIDLFEEKPELPVAPSPAARCVAFANVHHDPAKMERYERLIGRADQRFFVDRDAAEDWLARQG